MNKLTTETDLRRSNCKCEWHHCRPCVCVARKPTRLVGHEPDRSTRKCRLDSVWTTDEQFWRLIAGNQSTRKCETNLLLVQRDDCETTDLTPKVDCARRVGKENANKKCHVWDKRQRLELLNLVPNNLARVVCVLLLTRIGFRLIQGWLKWLILIDRKEKIGFGCKLYFQVF